MEEERPRRGIVEIRSLDHVSLDSKHSVCRGKFSVFELWTYYAPRRFSCFVDDKRGEVCISVRETAILIYLRVRMMLVWSTTKYANECEQRY